MDWRCKNPTNNVYSNINHKNVQHEQTIYNSLYSLTNPKLQLNYNLEDLYRTDDWKSTNSYKGKSVITYDNKVGNKTLHPRVFYALYIKPNGIGNGHLIYRSFMDQILVTKEYQSIYVPEDLIEAISKTNSSDNKIEAIHFNNDQAIV